MSSVSATWYLLKTNAPVIATIPASRVMAGDLPLNTVMPAMQITLISGQTRRTVKMSAAHVMHTDRVQVSYLFKGPQGTPPGTGYPGVRGMSALVLTACANRRGSVNGIDVDSILPDIEGPDLFDAETLIYCGSRDFIVKWTD